MCTTIAYHRSNDQSWRLRKGDVDNCLQSLEDNSYDAIFTDPPYGLGFMGKPWDAEVPPVGVWQEMLRACKPGAFLLAFGGTRTFHRLASNIEDAGWQVRDCLMWLHGQGFPKPHDIGKAIDKKLSAKRKVVGKKPKKDVPVPGTSEGALWKGYDTALKPAWETAA